MIKQTDRELLELVALAAGIVIHHWTDGREPHECPVLNDGIREHIKLFDPLTDNGDALRLAVKLSINIVPNYHAEWHFSVGGNFKAGREFTTECEVQADPCAATRRAIVRAAAQVGQSIQGVI